MSRAAMTVLAVMCMGGCATSTSAVPTPPPPVGEPFLPAYIKMLTDPHPSSTQVCDPSAILAPCDYLDGK